MPRRYITEIIHQLKGWMGINLRENPLEIQEKELADCNNFDVSLHGELIKRTGFAQKHDGSTLGANQVHLLGFFNTDIVQQFIARAGNNIYYSTDAITWTIIPGGPWGNVEYGVQYITNFYMVRRDDVIVKWDGATATAIAGSPQGSFCKVFKDRLFVLNSYATGRISSRMYFSIPFDFSTTGWPAINYVGVSEGDGDILVAAYNIQDHFLVFKTGGTWKLYVQGSDITAWILRPFSSEVGCIGRDTIAQYEGTVYFCTAKGVYHSDGNTVKLVSLNITNLWDSVVVSTTTINNHSAFIWKDKYVLILEQYPVTPIWNGWSAVTWGSLSTTPWTGSTAVYTTLVYHIKQSGWTKWMLGAGVTPHSFVTVGLNAVLKGVYGGERALTGKVYKYGDIAYNDNGVIYTADFKTKEEDLAEPAQQKRGKWTALGVVGGGNISVTHIVNGQATTPVVYTLGGSIEETKVAGPGHFRSWALYVAQTQDQPLTILNCGLVLQIGYGERRPIKTGV